jgi:hypothetical protein
MDLNRRWWGRWAWIPDRAKAVLVHLRFAGRVLPDPFYARHFLASPIFAQRWHSINGPNPRSEATFFLLVLRGLWMIALLKLRWIR